jgi:eukaryotic-like serine/threonine-protein kinase
MEPTVHVLSTRIPHPPPPRSRPGTGLLPKGLMFCAICRTPFDEQSRFCSTCGANLSDPELSTRQRLAVKELFQALRAAVEGRYRVLDMLGRGGMGAVFLAEDLKLDRRVAIKVLLPEVADEPGFVGRFQREARIAARLDHGSIIPIYEVEQVGDFHYFVMKYVAGKSLEEMLTGEPLPVPQASEILWQAAGGLDHAHQRGVVHRDVKPSNIMVEDGEGRVVITDFGISKAIQSESRYTSTGQMLGTPCYLSPEQAQGAAIDARSDQYSLAVLGYQMFVGRLPLVADTTHALLYKHIYEMPVPAQVARREVPTEISRALQRALSKQPEQRFPSMADFAAALWPERAAREGRAIRAAERDWSVGSDVAGRTARVLAGLRGIPRRWTSLIAAGLAVLAIGGVALAVLRGRPQDRPSAAVRAGTSETGAAAREPVVDEMPHPVTGVDSAIPPTGMSVPADTAGREPEAASAPPAPAVEPKPKPTPRPPRRGARPTRAPPETTATPVTTPATPSVGFVTINAVPYGTVVIDGIEVGDTPIVRYELTPGAHTVRIVRQGFRTESETVTITAGNEMRLSRTLVPEAR